ncbi:MAG TPA: NADH-quinone oxidoreductase subunit L, partial [Candidatus Dormibacteraeota bacterium]|nr:NADH-quinone oxidoreductase subunit L [Candidatus Dormibacteraeota bacterium]
VPVATGTAEVIALLLLVGAVAKSAQIPLHTWLPDAMEGPTPVSALIHAATMVTAGVYLIARFEPLYRNAPAAATTAAAIGAVTALMAGLIACVQTDIKRVLAYSTMSQIGYMFFAVAIGAEAAGIFHLVTHAFFKALLFLAAGNVIHALHGEQDMRRMGGLRARMPTTFWTFTIGALALAGVPPLAGFFSKDEIIGAGLMLGPLHPIGGVVLLATAGLTGYYMIRALYLTFLGQPSPRSARGHEPGPAMLAPVILLAFLAALGGLIQPGTWHLLTDYLARSAYPSPLGGQDGIGAAMIVAASLLLVAAGVGFAAARFSRPGAAAAVPDPAGSSGPLARAFYWNEIYGAVVVGPLYTLGALLAVAVEGPVVDGAVRLAAGATEAVGARVRRLQNGYIRSYALIFAAAVLLVVIAAGTGIR